MADQAQYEAIYDKALAISEKKLEDALRDGGQELAPFVAVTMIEAAVNSAADLLPLEDVAEMLQNILEQMNEDLEG